MQVDNRRCVSCLPVSVWFMVIIWIFFRTLHIYSNICKYNIYPCTIQRTIYSAAFPWVAWGNSVNSQRHSYRASESCCAHTQLHSFLCFCTTLVVGSLPDFTAKCWRPESTERWNNCLLKILHPKFCQVLGTQVLPWHTVHRHFTLSNWMLVGSV